MSLQTPNQEQKQAIFHQGGILLSAGAGAGKTFVLIEHIKYLFEECLKQNGLLSDEEKERIIKNKFSKIVLMTFTNKAAGELEIKLLKALREYEKSGKTFDFINQFKIAVEAMTITTIHGLCYKLLRSGMISDQPCEFKIISKQELILKIEGIFTKYQLMMIRERGQIPTLFVDHWKELEQVMCSIFQSPELRIMWEEMDLNSAQTWNINDFLVECTKVLGVSDLVFRKLDLSVYQNKETTKWYGFLKEFNNRSNFDFSIEGVEQWITFFKDKYERMPTVKQSSEEIVLWYSKIKIFKEFLFKYEDDFKTYLNDHDGVFVKWLENIKNSFDYVNQLYELDVARTFSDLEYYVFKGLRNSECLKRIQEHFQYFIVDEFQDTSTIQASIIEIIIGKNFNKLFAVGDPKQAIYGFRGGELKVFLDCSKKIGKNLYLKNNYRSKKEIIHFNNQAFAYLFKKGKGFEGCDDTGVEFVNQTIPDDKDNGAGTIYVNEVLLTRCEEAKCYGDEMLVSRIEAKQLLARIIDIRKKQPGEGICVLYKNLAPSKYLISLLLKENLEFNAQMKIEQESDLIFGMFELFIEMLHEWKCGNTYERIWPYYQLKLGCYLKYLSVDISLDFCLLVDSFIRDTQILGEISAFKKLLFHLGIANSNYKNNLMNIEAITRRAEGDTEKLLGHLQSIREEKFSINFQTGNELDSIQIMTCHASKGLEFDHILVGGIHTNGRTIADRSIVGKIPGSIKWNVSENATSKLVLSPEKIYERLLDEKVEFSESKRLFYVAFTRAIKSISWVSVTIDGEPFVKSKSSWIHGLRKLAEETQLFIENQNLVIDRIEIGASEINREDFQKSQRPFYMQDAMGLTSKISMTNRKDVLGLVSELSATAFSTIASCQRKFYFQNICKIRDEDLEGMISDNRIEDVESFEDELHFVSSAKRGSRVHERISQIINSGAKNFEQITSMPKGDHEAIKWCLEIINKENPNHDLISEERMKFSLYGHMLTAVLDLQAYPKDESAKITLWDFKTGARQSESEESYWCQLFTYAMALYKLNRVNKIDTIVLILAYLDEREIIKREVSLNQVNQYLFFQWEKLSDLFKINAKHCQFCKYIKICSNSCTP